MEVLSFSSGEALWKHRSTPQPHQGFQLWKLYPPWSSLHKASSYCVRVDHREGNMVITLQQHYLALIQFLLSELQHSLSHYWTNILSEQNMALKQSLWGLAKGILLFIITFLWIQGHLCFWSLTRHLFLKTPEPQSPHVNPWPTVTAAQWCDGEGRLDSILL